MPGRKKNIGIPRKISDDSIRISKSDNKVKLFAKFNHKWYSTDLKDAFDITNQNDASVDSILTYTSKNKGKVIPRITASMAGEIGLWDATKSNGVMLKQDSGELKVRNKDNTADALISAKRVKLSTDTSGTGSAVVGEMAFDSTTQSYHLHGQGLAVNSTTTGTSGDSASILIISKNNDSTLKLLDGATTKWTIGYDRFTSVGAFSYQHSNNATTSGSALVEIEDVTPGSDTIVVGMLVEGDGIPNESVVTVVTPSVSLDSFTMSKVATSTESNVNFTFSPVSTANKFKIDTGSSLTDTSVFEISTTGGLQLFGTGASLLFGYDSSNYGLLLVASDGHVYFQSIGTDADMTFDSGADISLDSGNGVFIAKNAGTEFSAANSAYAGMILGCTHVFGSGTNGVFQAVTTAWESLLWDTDKYALVTFVVPPSNKVKISVHFPYILGASYAIQVGLATDSSASSLDAKYQNKFDDANSTDSFNTNYSWVVDGSDHSWSAGETKTLYIMAYSSAGTRFYTGGSNAGYYGGVIVEATALPATISDGSEP